VISLVTILGAFEMDGLEYIRRRKIEKMMKDVNSQPVFISVSDGNFDNEVINKSADIPVVVDFWATWCMPCMALGPVLEKLAQEYGDKFILAKLNVDENPAVSHKYGIMSIPSVKMFKGGKVVDEFVGALPEFQVKTWLDRNLY